MGLAQLSTLSDCATFSFSHLEDCFSKHTLTVQINPTWMMWGGGWGGGDNEFNRSDASNCMSQVIFGLVNGQVTIGIISTDREGSQCIDVCIELALRGFS